MIAAMESKMFLVALVLLFGLSYAGATGIDNKNQSTESTDAHVELGGCPNSYIRFEDHCYFFGQDRLTWYDAVTVCEIVLTEKKKSWVSQVKSLKEKVFLRKHISGSDAWIGGTDVLKHGNFIWYGYSDMQAKDWFKNPIPKAQSYAQCLLLDTRGRIRADRCDRKRHFVCEQKM